MRLKNKIGILLGTLLLCSCNAWLDVKQINQTEESDLFSTERGFEKALAGVYYGMSGGGMYGQKFSYGMLDVMSRTYDYLQIPDGMKIYRDYDYKDQTMEAEIAGAWRDFYAKIAELNNILQWSETNASVLSPEKRRQIRGEALALRAFLHFDIYRLFAVDVKLDSEVKRLPYQLDFGVVAPPVYSTEDYLSLVARDLKEALQNLENDPIRDVKIQDWENTDGDIKKVREYTLRMNYYAVEAMLARVYLSMGEKKLARELAEEVIDCGAFALLNYERSLNVEEEEKDLLFSDEHIFTLENKNIKEWAKNIHKQQVSTDGNLQMSANFQASVYLADVDDYRLNWFKESFVMKYTSDTEKRFVPSMPLIRLSEMYLIAAEGWMDDDSGRASELLRTFKQSRTKTPVVAEEVTEELLIREIRKEFVGEGQIFFAYKRLNHDIVGNTSEDSMEASNSVFVFPLPEQEIQYGNRH